MWRFNLPATALRVERNPSVSVKYIPGNTWKKRNGLSSCFQANQFTPANPNSKLRSATDVLGPLYTLILELADLPVQLIDCLHALFDGSRAPTLYLPPADAFHLGLSTPPFGLDLVAEFALLASGKRGVHQLHPARFTDAVFLVAMGPKVSPLPILASIDNAVVVAHCRKKSLGAASVPALAFDSGFPCAWLAYICLVLVFGWRPDWFKLGASCQHSAFPIHVNAFEQYLPMNFLETRSLRGCIGWSKAKVVPGAKTG